jgi:hypothetical protein
VLASHYLFQGRTDDARRHLASIRNVASGQRDYFRRAMAAAGLAPSAAPALADD